MSLIIHDKCCCDCDCVLANPNKPRLYNSLHNNTDTGRQLSNRILSPSSLVVVVGDSVNLPIVFAVDWGLGVRVGSKESTEMLQTRRQANNSIKVQRVGLERLLQDY